MQTYSGLQLSGTVKDVYARNDYAPGLLYTGTIMRKDDYATGLSFKKKKFR